MKNVVKFYASPTPKKWRKLGDALLMVSTTLSTYSVVEEWGKSVTIAIMITGVVGKFLSNFFSEDEPK
jgi:hypothetical protein